jgi:hypothetical protein
LSTTVNAQQEAVALWKYLESRSIRPSIRKVVAMMRGAQIGVNEADASKWLAKFAAANPHPKALRSKNPAEAPHESATASSTQAEQIQHADQHTSSDSPALTRTVEVSLSTKIEPTAPTLALGLEVLPPSQPVKVRAPQADRRSPAEQTADAALSEVRETVEPALSGMTWTTWKARNRKVVVDMARSGMTADEIVVAHEEASEARGGVAMVMAWVQERVVRQAATAAPVSAKQAEVDNLPSVANGAKGTAPDDIPPWERPPNHARYVRWSAEFEAQWNTEHRQPAMA